MVREEPGMIEGSSGSDGEKSRLLFLESFPEGRRSLQSSAAARQASPAC